MPHLRQWEPDGGRARLGRPVRVTNEVHHTWIRFRPECVKAITRRGSDNLGGPGARPNGVAVQKRGISK